MKFYGIDVQGYFKLKEYVDLLPIYDGEIHRRDLVYLNDSVSGNDRIYIGGRRAGNWVEVITSQILNNNYYTVDASNLKFLSTSNTGVLDADQWIGKVVFDPTQSGSYVIPSGSTICNVANSGVFYNNAQGANQVVKRDSSGDIFANIGHLTATAAQYADLAEKYTCDESIPTGTVMEVDFNSDDEVVECQFELSTSVVGIVSDNPAYLMNSSSEGLPIALTGKVPVRIIGSISKGDFIVSAGNGLARKGHKLELLYKIGIALESNLVDEEKLVTCIIK